MENHHAINGQTHYFNGHLQVRKTVSIVNVITRLGIRRYGHDSALDNLPGLANGLPEWLTVENRLPMGRRLGCHQGLRKAAFSAESADLRSTWIYGDP